MIIMTIIIIMIGLMIVIKIIIIVVINSENKLYSYAAVIRTLVYIKKYIHN